MELIVLEVTTNLLTTSTSTSIDASATLPPYLTPHGQPDNVTLVFAVNETCQYNYRPVNFTEYLYEYRKETWIPITWRELVKVS
ncbi:hypothetical protein Hamer_G025505, partial [Homarus americanus]